MQIDSEKLYQGDTWNFSESFSDYPPSTHIVTLYTQKVNGIEIAAQGVADDEDSTMHEFTVPATDTIEIESGTYKYVYQAYEISTEKKYTFHLGVITVNPRHGGPSEDMIFWTNRLAELQTAYTSWAARGYAEITLPGGDSVKYEDGDKLLQHIAYAKTKINNLRNAERGCSNIKVHQAKFTY
jgi:hypothetical protein